MSVFAERRHVWIVIRDYRALLFQHADDVECRTLAHVVDVLLVRHAEEKDARTAQERQRHPEHV
ncbi:hypothetical protein D3C83_87570 [compost metagenome]